MAQHQTNRGFWETVKEESNKDEYQWSNFERRFYCQLRCVGVKVFEVVTCKSHLFSYNHCFAAPVQYFPYIKQQSQYWEPEGFATSPYLEQFNGDLG